MYIQSFNPNQAVALSQGFRSSAAAFPVSIRPSIQGNTVVYAFNPAAAQGMVLNPIANQAMSLAYNPAILSGLTAWNNPALLNAAIMNQPITTAAISPLATAAWNNPFINPAIQQGFINPFLSGQIGIQGTAIQASTGLAQMRVDLHETNSDVIVAAELPNVSLNDLNLTVTDDSISISATAFAGAQATSLFRTVALPSSIKAEQVEATYANGILEVRAPKSDVVTRRRVKVNVIQ
ncbi:MAG: Hsp20/alpha crystallin family protein [Bacillota bacterium]